MSQLFCFEGRFITLAQINMIKENRLKESDSVKKETLENTKEEEAIEKDDLPSDENHVEVVGEEVAVEPIIKKVKKSKK
jgi:hypothetical protein